MSRKILITGATGFAGSYLAEFLQGENEVFGTYFTKESRGRLRGVLDRVKFLELDLRRKDQVEKVVKESDPDEVYHLAALSSPWKSFNDPAGVLENNIVGQVNLFEAIKKMKKRPRVLVIGSADEYGLVDKEDIPIDEEVCFNPTNPYSVSKLTQDYLGRQYFLSYGMSVVRVRPFNHIGPRQEKGFVVSDFAIQIAKIEKDGGGKLRVGNLKAVRDFTDVRDMVRAYVLALREGEVGDVYNIGSGKGYSIGEILDILVSYSKRKIEIEEDEKLFRQVDNPEIICNNKKFVEVTGWEREFEIAKTLEDVLDYFRK